MHHEPPKDEHDQTEEDPPPIGLRNENVGARRGADWASCEPPLASQLASSWASTPSAPRSRKRPHRPHLMHSEGEHARGRAGLKSRLRNEKVRGSNPLSSTLGHPVYLRKRSVFGHGVLLSGHPVPSPSKVAGYWHALRGRFAWEGPFCGRLGSPLLSETSGVGQVQ